VVAEDLAFDVRADDLLPGDHIVEAPVVAEVRNEIARRLRERVATVPGAVDVHMHQVVNAGLNIVH